MTVHLSIHPSREGWVGFETDPRLRVTKRRLHERCLPCMTGLLEQLRADPSQVELREAWECWKVVAVVETRDQALELLQEFAARHPDEYLVGKLGTGRGRTTVALMFHTEQEATRDRLFALLQETAARLLPGSPVFTSRGCGDPYERLLGPWQEWCRVSPVRHPDRVEPVLRALRESLYGSSS